MVDPLVLFLVRALRGAARLLPMEGVVSVGRALGWVVSWFAWPWRDVFARNWGIVFGRSATGAEWRACWAGLAGNLVASLRFGQLTLEQKRAAVELVHLDRLRAAAAPGRGVILATAHLGCWELLAQIPELIPDLKFHTLYQPLANRGLDQLVREERARCGVGLIPRRGAWRAMTERLRSGDVVAVFADQNAGDAGYWVPFFGRLASSSPVPATIAQRSGAAIVGVAVRTTGRGRWAVEFSEPLGAGEGDAARVTARVNTWIEGAVRASPEDWLWLHDRWKIPNPRCLLAHGVRGVSVPEGTTVEPFRVLVRGMNWLGDAVMHLGALRDLKAGRPDLRLAVLTHPKLADLYRHCPWVDDVLEIPGGKSLWGAARMVRAWAPDVMVLLPNSWRVVCEAWLGGARQRIGYRVNGRGRRAINHKIPLEKRARGLEHQSLTWTRAVTELGGVVSAEPAWLAVTRDPGRDVYGVLAPGAEYGPAKRWAPERFAELAAGLSEDIPRWIIVGARGDHAACAEVSVRLPEAENRCGTTNLAELITLLAGATVVVSNDSGTAHLAAACGAPTVAVFGSTEPRLTRPVHPGVAVVRRHVACSPCFRRTCPLRHTRCLDAVTVEDVVRGVRSALSDGGVEPLAGLAAGA
jgi:ADP-heptose:LPS heptosyltransferase/lauroyl/myristoyl acyltransferase